MTPSEYDQNVKQRLVLIEAGAAMAARHAKALPFKPDFTTHAQDELAESRAVLEAALQNVIEAQAIYSNKPVEKSHAA